MADDPILTLEKQLVGAARRRGRTPRRLNAGTLASVAAAAVAVAVAAGALLLLGGRSRPTSPATAKPSGLHQLTDILGVLRRPQTKTDLRILRQSRLLSSPGILINSGKVDVASARLATITPWGSRVLVALMYSEAKSKATASHLPRALDPRTGLLVEADHGSSCCGTARSIEAAGAVSLDGAGRSFAGGSAAIRVYAVVPDGVAKVAFYSPAQSVPAGGPTYPHSLTVTVPVHGNVAAVELHRECCNIPLMVWYGADGQVIKRVGNFAAASHRQRPPQPSPPTALSRAALRNPATPNPVTVTPAFGPPSTVFAARFRILINDADYLYRLTEPPGCRGLSASGIAGGGGPFDIRGRVFRIPFITARRSLCPGSYKVSVALYDLGRAGGLHGRRPVPFGSATFTVRR